MNFLGQKVLDNLEHLELRDSKLEKENLKRQVLAS